MSSSTKRVQILHTPRPSSAESTSASFPIDSDEQQYSAGLEVPQASRSTVPSHMSRRSIHGDTEEVTPIRHAAAGETRNYNTSGTSQTAPDPRSTSSAAQQSKPSGEAVTDDDAANGRTKQKESKIKSFVERYGAITLENKGSVARDHLALERTFLAWLRTSLAFASIGIAITQLFRLNTSIQRRTQSIDALSSLAATSVPYSPFIGHALPVELTPYLQGIVASPNIQSAPSLGPTLLDQILMLDANGNSVYPNDIGSLQQHGSTRVDTTAADSKIRHIGKPLGATFIGISIVILLIGFHRYFESQYWIIRGKFPASRGSIALVGLITSGLIIASLIVVVVVDPASYERKK